MENKIVSQKYKYDGMVSHHRYEGVRMESGDVHCLKMVAHFQRDTYDLGYVVFEKGDRFVEYYYDNKYYNIFAIYKGDSDMLKGWYCNLARPATWSEHLVEFVDLALDLWVDADGSYLILDEDEFEELDLEEGERESVLSALTELITMVEAGSLPR